MRYPRGMKFAAVAAVLAMALTACGGSDDDSASTDSTSGSDQTLKIGLAYDIGGRGDKSFNDAAAAGFDKAAEEFKLENKELAAKADEVDADKEARLKELADAGYNTIVAVGFAYANALKTVAPDYPDVKFQIIDDSSVTAENVSSYTFKENESAYLVGALAALSSKTGTIGFVGGVNNPLIQKFQAGFEAGAKAAKPSIKVLPVYISQPPDFSGFAAPDKGKVAATGLYERGADVVYAAAGLSNNGVFEAAAATKKWAIGTDSDQFLSAAPAVKPYIIGSALKGVDTAVYDFIKSVENDSFKAGNTELGLKEDGVGYVINNEQFKQFATQIDKFKADIVAGTIKVPTTV
ncbi:BMP family lipoprotein [Cryptosporangium minutisporangium]|uniref:BMP family ABC transporter substrate-binding protein n=1 Tax=Cryptosporangium minutisporangium TaxID=113569 RepID=A0ABP6T4P6_9ACTN